MGLVIPRVKKLQMAGQVKTQPVPMRPPMTGWNTRDDLDGMEPTDAVTMDNFIADAGGVLARNGSVSYATGLGAQVNTLAEYYTTSTRKLLAGANNKLFDVSVGGAVGAALGTFSSDKWQTQNYDGLLFLANGVDAVQSYNGTTVSSAGFTGPGTPPIGVFAFKNRLYFWSANDNQFWYTPTVDTITGALTAFPLKDIAQFGGNVSLLTNFSHDGGDGLTNLFCIVMTTGEIILYIGNDPGNASNWSLVAKYKLAAPIGIRSAANYGAECYLTTFDDHLGLQQQLVALKVGQFPPRSKISGAVKTALLANPTAFGYQAIYYKRGRRLLFNIPNVDGTFDQHVFNTSLQTWSRFRGMPASCWSEFNDNLYFGTPGGTVWQADTGTTDGGAAISALCQQAWSQLQIPVRKRLAGIRAVIQSSGPAAYNFAAGFDYVPATLPLLSALPSTGSFWDVSPWDVSSWSAETQTDTRVHVIGGSGSSLGVLLQAQLKQSLTWMRTDLLLETGSTL